MFHNVVQIAGSSHGRIIISFILGLGLASLFRHTCGANECIALEAPPFESITEKTYEYEGDCVRFRLNPGSCNSEKKIIDTA